MNEQAISDIVERQRTFFRTEKTLDLPYRRQALLALQEAIQPRGCDQRRTAI